MTLEKRLTEYWQSNSLTEPGNTVIVACSGGPDSLALLDVLWSLKERLAIKVVAAHYEHGIRGKASKDDESFVKNYCLEREIPFYSASANIPELSRIRGESLETCARQMRYAFLNKLAGELRNALIATAHHADDQAETVLMHLLRGLGLTDSQEFCRSGEILFARCCPSPRQSWCNIATSGGFPQGMTSPTRRQTAPVTGCGFNCCPY